MLERLDDIDWGALTDAFGPATAVPQALRGLIAFDADEREAALFRLYDGLCHQQCTVAEATAYAVPFLLELSDADAVPDRDRILRLLGDIVRASAPADEREDFDDDDEGPGKPDVQEQIETELTWVRQARTAVWRGLDLYLRLLDDDDRQLRCAAAYVLSFLAHFAAAEIPDPMLPRDPAGRVARALRDRLLRERDEFVKTNLVFALGALTETHPDARAPLADLVWGPAGRRVRLAAAMNLVGDDGTVPEPALDVLVEALARYRETDNMFQDVPWFDGYLRFYLIDRLCRLGPEFLPRTLPALLGALRAGSAYTAESDARPILRLVFDDQEVPEDLRGEDLTEPQRQVLKVLAENPTFWCGVNNGEMELLELGLPESRRRLRAMLKRPGENGHHDRPAPTAHDGLRVLDQAVAEGLPLRRPEANGEAANDNPAQIYREAMQYEERSRRRKIGERQRQKVRRLDLSGRANDAVLAQLYRCPRVQKLRLEKSDVTDAGLVYLEGMAHLRRLHLTGTAIHDRGLRHLTALATLEHLDLSDTEIDDAGLPHLLGLKNLQRLWLIDATVGDDGMRSVGQIPALQNLNLSGTRLTDRGLKHLAGLRRLRVLWLYHTELTDAALPALARLTALRRLSLCRTQIAGHGLSALTALRSLRVLDLSGTPLEDDRLAELAQLRSLRVLDLAHTAVTDAGLAHLHSLTNLKELYLNETVVTNEAIDELRQHLTGCRVSKPGYDKPQSVEDFNQQAYGHYHSGAYDKAIAAHLEALKLDPHDAATGNCLAWIWATCPDDRLRNGPRALEYARRSCERTEFQEPGYLDTLAAAHAECGDFAQATYWEQRVLELLPEEEHGEYRARLELYEMGQPYRAR
jgi:Leucine-rich repeat (LRR) protein